MSKARKFAVVGATIVAVAIGCLAANAITMCMKVEKVFTRFKALTPGESAKSDLDDFIREGLLTPLTDCSYASCDYEARIANVGLSHLHLASPRGLVATFHLEHGTLSRSSAAVMGEFVTPGVIIERKSCRNCEVGNQTYFAKLHNELARVQIDQNATPEEKAKAFQINLHILCGLRNMKRGRQLAPAVWQGQSDDQ